MSERAGLVIALLIATLGGWFAWQGANSPSGTVDGSPPEAFFVFIVIGSFAFIGDARVLARGTLTNAQRCMRHLWRMCTSFFIAAGSFFVGQPQVFPDWFNQTQWPNALAFAPIAIMIFFLVWLSVGESRTRKAVETN